MNGIKYRHELKYVVSGAQIEWLKSRLNGIVPLDSHVGPTGIYNVRSVYFDDYYHRCFYENENGTDPREKFRIRIYNHSDSRVSLECKRKERGKTLKISSPLTVMQTNSLLAGEILDVNNNALLNKLAVQMRLYGMRPTIIVEYDRIPYVYKQGNVRITFDTNISASKDYDSFFKERINKRPIMPSGMQLLEVKYDEYLPDYIYRALQLDSLQQTSFSKFYLCSKYVG